MKRLAFSLTVMLFLSATCARAQGTAAQQSGLPKRIEDISFIGLESIKEGELSKALVKYFQLGADYVYDPARAEEAASFIADKLWAKGYTDATVRVRKKDLSESTCELTFIVDEGAGLRITQVEFRGNKVFSGAELLKAMRCTLEHNRADLPALDVPYDASIVEADARLVQLFIAERGYLQARVREPEVEDKGRNRKLILTVEEGRLYRLGEIKIEGATQFSDEEILEFIRVKPGEIADGREIGAGLFERLKRAYAERGFIQYDAAPQPTFRPLSTEEGIVDFDITIDEGTRFKVISIRFEGNTKTPESTLRAAMRLREGEVYNQTKFEEGIRRLNRMGLFKPIDDRRDTDFRTDDEESLMSIVIKVREVTATNPVRNQRP